MFQSALTGGIAIGAWLWGQAAGAWGVAGALIASGIALALTALVGLLIPLPRVSLSGVEMASLANEPEVALAVTERSGPVVIEIDYRVDAARAREFYELMLQVQRTRLKNGGFNWSIARDIADPELWTERFHCPTWGDYLHQRSRYTKSDLELQQAADAFNQVGWSRQVRRRLERPVGSVRWRAETPDPKPIRSASIRLDCLAVSTRRLPRRRSVRTPVQAWLGL